MQSRLKRFTSLALKDDSICACIGISLSEVSVQSVVFKVREINAHDVFKCSSVCERRACHVQMLD